MNGPETCWAVYIAGFSVAIRCALTDGHEGSHRSDIGQSWDDPKPQLTNREGGKS